MLGGATQGPGSAIQANGCPQVRNESAANDAAIPRTAISPVVGR